MKNLLLLISLVFTLETLAQSKPVSLKGQADTAYQLPKPEIQVPNYGMTNLGGLASLIETGNMNLLSNPGFEHNTYTTGHTTTGTTGTLSAESSILIAGKKAMKIVTSAQNIAVVQDSTLFASQLAGMQGYIKAWIYNSAPSVSFCARAAGSTLTGNNCVTLATDSLYKEYTIPIVLSATSNGYSLAGTGVTGTTIIDEVYVGLISGAMPEVSQARLVAAGYISNANCTPVTTSASMVDFTSDADCGAPTSTISGSLNATDANALEFTPSFSLQPGRYVAVIETSGTTSTSANAGIRVTDGTNNGEQTGFNHQADGNRSPMIATLIVDYTSTASRTFKLQGSTSAGTITVYGTNTPDWTKFRLYYYPPASNIYSQQCSDVRSCANTFSFTVGSTGTVSAESLDFINGNCTNADPRVCTFNTGFLTVAPNCTTDGGEPVTAVSSSTVSIDNTVKSTAIICQKQGVDYKQESLITGTFRNVVTTDGVSKPSLVSASIDASEVVTEDDSDFITTCTNADPSVCTVTSSYYTADPKCWAEPTSAGTIAAVTADTTASITIDRTDASTPFKLFCHGAR